MNELIKNYLKTYLAKHPEEVERQSVLSTTLDSTEEDLTSRKVYPLHVTASAVVIDEITGQTLLVRHSFLKKWVFPGGHVDQGEHLVNAAIREMREETGIDVTGFAIHLLDIDRHDIPANPKKDEPAHQHADFRFAFCGKVDRSTLRISDESTGFLWVDSKEDLFEHWHGPEAIRERIMGLLVLMLYCTR